MKPHQVSIRNNDDINDLSDADDNDELDNTILFSV
jgi:hypothetical protein